MFGQEGGCHFWLKCYCICRGDITSLKQETNISSWSSINVSGKYTFTKKLLLLRVEETEFSLSTAARVKKLTPLAQFNMLSLSVLNACCLSVTRHFPP